MPATFQASNDALFTETIRNRSVQDVDRIQHGEVDPDDLQAQLAYRLWVEIQAGRGAEAPALSA